MIIAEFQQTFERTTPPGVAWKNDNIGLLVGRVDANITNILVTLDVTMDVAIEALRLNANLIVTHHPLIFRPLSAITGSTPTGTLLMFLIEHNIAVYAAHTNFDSVRHGVSFALASHIGVSAPCVLSPMKDSLVKITVFVPHTHVEQVASAMHSVGGGMFTNYEQCSFRTNGTGTFMGKNNARPFVGSVGVLEHAPEIRLEMPAERWNVNAVVAAIRRTHPYEEVAYDISALENSSNDYGLGAVGNLVCALDGREFLSHVKIKLGAEMLRYAGDVQRQIRRVAVCGGSGSDLIRDAVRSGADAFVTADLKYHQMQDAAEDMLVVDAGHYETEYVSLSPLAEHIRNIGIGEEETMKIFISQHTKNPIHFC